MEGIFEFISKIPSGVWDILPAFGAPGWIGGVIKGLVGLTGLTALARFLPDNWCYMPIVQVGDKLGLLFYAPLFGLGKGVSELGRSVLGKKRWEKVEENVFERAIGLIFNALFDSVSIFFQRVKNGLLDGLDADDNGTVMVSLKRKK